MKTYQQLEQQIINACEQAVEFVAERATASTAEMLAFISESIDTLPPGERVAAMDFVVDRLCMDEEWQIHIS